MRVGVTGHRNVDPADWPPLRAAFGRLLASLLPRSPGASTMVISGMAAGADTLAAEEALARSVPVVAALAAPLETYELDFPGEERASLRERVARCTTVVTLTDGSDRAAGYLAVREYLAGQSDVLVAFWDGIDNRKPGGTADVVHAGMRGPVYQIVTPRLGAPRPARAYELRKIFP